MMTIEEIESACDTSQLLDFSRHELEAPELSLNEDVLSAWISRRSEDELDRSAGPDGGAVGEIRETARHRTNPFDVHVVESGSTECPPAPVYRIMMPLLVTVADADNYSIVDLARNRTQITISTCDAAAHAICEVFSSRNTGVLHLRRGIRRRCTPRALHWTGVACCCAAIRAPASLLFPMRARERDGHMSPTMGAIC